MKKAQKSAGQAVLEFPSGRIGTPEATAKRAVARMETTVSGHRVKLPLTLFLTREVAEYIAARAIREGKNTAGVVAEILTAESGGSDQQAPTCRAGGVMVSRVVAVILVLAVLAAPMAVEPQQAGKVYRIGLLRIGPPPSGFIEPFQQGLRDLGYVEGRNLIIENGLARNVEQLPELAAELLRLKVDVILASGSPYSTASAQRPVESDQRAVSAHRAVSSVGRAPDF